MISIRLFRHTQTVEYGLNFGSCLRKEISMPHLNHISENDVKKGKRGKESLGSGGLAASKFYCCIAATVWSFFVTVCYNSNAPTCSIHRIYHAQQSWNRSWGSCGTVWSLQAAAFLAIGKLTRDEKHGTVQGENSFHSRSKTTE